MKILIVRFSAIGDCVMTTWPVTGLRNLLPEAQLFWAVQERCSPVIDTDHLVNQLQIFPREQWKQHRWAPKTWREQILTYSQLRPLKIDVGFDFQGHSKTALCLRLAGCSKRYASRATDSLAARLNPPLNLSPAGPHEVELGFALVQKVFDIKPPVVPEMPKVSCSDEPQVTIQTGAGELDKRYPIEQWKHVADHLVKLGLKVTAIGGPGDPKLDCQGVGDSVGSVSLIDSMALVARSKVHISADTGSAHIAAAYGVPTVTIFGRTDPARFRPWGGRSTVLRVGAETSLVQPESVVQSALQFLEDRTFAHPH